MELFYLFLISRILVESCLAVKENNDKEKQQQRNEQFKSEFTKLIDKQLARFSKESKVGSESQQGPSVKVLPENSMASASTNSEKETNGKQIVQDKNLDEESTKLKELSHEYDIEEVMKLVKTLPKIDVKEISGEQLHAAKDASKFLNEEDENLMKNISSDLSKLNFTKGKTNARTNINIAKSIDEKKLAKINEIVQRPSEESHHIAPQINDQNMQTDIDLSARSDHVDQSGAQTGEQGDQRTMSIDLSNKQNENVIPIAQHSGLIVSMSEGTCSINDKSDQSSGKTNSQTEKSDQYIEKASKIQRKRIERPRKQIKSNSTRTESSNQKANQNEQSPNPINQNIDSISVENAVNLKKSDQIAEARDIFTDSLDQTAIRIDPITENIDLITHENEPSAEHIQMIPLHMLTMTKHCEKEKEKCDLIGGDKSDQNSHEASTGHRKRGRTKKPKFDENKNKNAIKEKETEMHSESTHSHSAAFYPNRYGVVKRIRKNKKYTLANILGMYVYEKNRRLFFVEWEGYEIESCWLQSENMNAQEMVAKFIEDCSISSALSAFSAGAQVTEHIANLLHGNAKSMDLMKNMGINPEKMATTKNIIFSEAIKPSLKEKALSTIDKFLKDNQIQID